MDTVTYSLIFSNPGTAPVINANLTDQLPPAAAVSYVAGSASNGGVYQSSANTLTWSIPVIPAGASVTETYQMTVGLFAAQYNPVVNQAQLTYPGGSVQASQTLTVTGAYVVQVAIYNGAGELVKTLSQFQFTFPITNFALSGGVISSNPGTATILYNGVTLGTWNATNTSGQPVGNGTYFAKVSTTDPFGVTTSVTQQITVNVPPSSLQLTVFNSAGEEVKSLDTAQIEALMGVSALSAADYSVGAAKLSSGTISPSYTNPGGPGASVTITLGSGGSFVWNGAGDNGQLLNTGSYIIELKSTQPNSSSLETTWNLVVESSTGSIASVVLAPNPIYLSKTQTAQFRITVNSPMVDNVQIDFYTLAGELMKLTVVSPVSSGDNVINWNVGTVDMASGMYIAVVQLKSGGNFLARQILKVAVIH
jgi:uncharacterized repeat protein (TIGR01451 family)